MDTINFYRPGGTSSPTRESDDVPSDELHVQLPQNTSDTIARVEEAEAETAVRPDVEAAVKSCEDTGRMICGQLQGGAQAERTGYAKFLGQVVDLHHAMTPEQRQHYVNERGVPGTGPEKLTSPYLHLAQALFSPDKDVRWAFKGQLTKWAQIGRGVIEGCGIQPNAREVEAFLLARHGRKKGRTMALNAYKGLADVRERAERDGQGKEGRKRQADLERALKVFSSTMGDDLSWPESEELARGIATALDVLERRGFREIPVSDGTITLERVEPDDAEAGLPPLDEPGPS